MNALMDLSASELQRLMENDNPSPSAFLVLRSLVSGPQRISILAMQESVDFTELHGRGLIDAGQEMNSVSANFPAGPKFMKVVSVNPMFIWVQLSDKGWAKVLGHQ